MLAEGVLCLLILDHLALRAQNPRHHLRILVADLLLLELLEAPVLMDHSLGLGNGGLFDLAPFEEAGAAGEVIARVDHALREVELRG